jgi:hypothetical protein
MTMSSSKLLTVAMDMCGPYKHADEIGNEHGRLTIVSESFRRAGRSNRFHLCLCRCGSLVPMNRSQMLSGGTVSCGCYNREQRIEQGKANATHGCMPKMVLR